MKRVRHLFVALRFRTSPTVYGLNFMSTADCDIFTELWEEVRRDRLTQVSTPGNSVAALSPLLRNVRATPITDRTARNPVPAPLSTLLLIAKPELWAPDSSTTGRMEAAVSSHVFNFIVLLH